MRKEATLPIAGRMQNVSFAVSIDPACRKSAGLRQKMRHGDMPEALGPTALGLLKKIMPHLSVRLSRKVVEEEDGAYEAGPGCISAT